MDDMNKPLLSQHSGLGSDHEESSSGGGVMGSIKKAMKEIKNKLHHKPPVVHSGLDHVVVAAGSSIEPVNIEILISLTNNFNDDNILGQGASGTVYKGQTSDRDLVIAVKRMHHRSTSEFESQLAVLTNVRHLKHLVAILGYCMDGGEFFLIYQHMPQGSLSRHLFDWEAEGLEPLGWDRRLIIAFDVARTVNYLHDQTFIHGNLKPTNILLGNYMRAKIADFGLASHRISSAVFGYFAPECISATGGMTNKVDVYSFGVILMELITGRKAFDTSQPEDSMHLVPWFRSMYVAKDSFCTAIDQTIINEESLASIHTVADLAVHCTAREPDQRPNMSYAVTVLSSLVQ